MARKVTGSPEQIDQVVTNDGEFESLKQKIAKDNNLLRCTCGQLLAKFDDQGSTINIQRKGLDVIAESSSMKIKCPRCKSVKNVT